jgi:type VI secretion system secreted protein VgrG
MGGHEQDSEAADFLNRYGNAAKAAAKKWKIPPSVLLAQAAHETGWGRHVKNNAFFGIKGKSPEGKSTSFKTTEFVDGKTKLTEDTFRAYANFDEAADDYGRFLSQNPRYKKCFSGSLTPENFVENLSNAGYATDPNYEKKIVSLIKKNGLKTYDN